MTELKEIIRSFLEKKGAHDFIITDLLTTNNGINKISIQLNSASVENFEIIMENLKNRGIIPEIEISEKIKKEPMEYLKFLIEIRKNDSFWKNVFEDYEIIKKENIRQS